MSSAAEKGKKSAVCNNCTLKLVTAAYERRPLFRLVREPMNWGMRFFSRLYCIDPDEYEVRTPACRGCNRFRKTALKERSLLFRHLNGLINPVFDRCLDNIMTEEERSKAREHARLATAGEPLDGPEGAGDDRVGSRRPFGPSPVPGQAQAAAGHRRRGIHQEQGEQHLMGLVTPE